MNEQILTFLNRLDQALIPFAKMGQCFDMFHLGRSALVAHHGFLLSTTDVDFVWIQDSELVQKAIELLGKGSSLAEVLGLYLDPVPSGDPPVPRWYRSRAIEVPGSWQVLRLWKLEVHDLAVTKLKCFRPKDREDLQGLCDRGLLAAKELRESLDATFPLRSPKAEDENDDPDTPEWGKALANLRKVEDYLNGKTATI